MLLRAHPCWAVQGLIQASRCTAFFLQSSLEQCYSTRSLMMRADNHIAVVFRVLKRNEIVVDNVRQAGVSGDTKVWANQCNCFISHSDRLEAGLPAHLTERCCVLPQLDKIQTPWIVALLNVQLVKTLITVLVPTLALRVFLLLVPSIMAVLCRGQGMASRSQIEFGVMRKYFVFSVRTQSTERLL